MVIANHIVETGAGGVEVGRSDVSQGAEVGNVLVALDHRPPVDDVAQGAGLSSPVSCGYVESLRS